MTLNVNLVMDQIGGNVPLVLNLGFFLPQEVLQLQLVLLLKQQLQQLQEFVVVMKVIEKKMLIINHVNLAPMLANNASDLLNMNVLLA